MKKLSLISTLFMLVSFSQAHTLEDQLAQDFMAISQAMEMSLSEEGAAYAASLYVLSNPLLQPHSKIRTAVNNESFRAFLRRDPFFFRKMGQFGQYLIERARYLPNPPKLPGTHGGMSAGTEWDLIGKEFKWLARVLPAAVQGDWFFYHQRGSELGKMYRLMIQMGYPRPSTLDPYSKQQIDAITRQHAVQLTQIGAKTHIFGR